MDDLRAHEMHDPHGLLYHIERSGKMKDGVKAPSHRKKGTGSIQKKKYRKS